MSKPNQSVDIEIPFEVIDELLTPSETKMLKQRVKILTLVADGKSIREIARRVEVGTDTVVRMIRKLESSEKLQSYFVKRSDSTSKWIFGQVGSEEI